MLFEYETRRLLLKILRPDAAPQVLDFYLRDQAYFEQYEPTRPPQFYTTNFQKASLKYEYNLTMKLQEVRFYVFRKENPSFIIGTVCFHHILSAFYSSCEVGYKFSSAFHHHGYASEALQKGMEIMFTDVHLHRIMAWVLPDNMPSIRLLESNGFVCEGLCKDYLYLHDHWADHLQYRLLAQDFVDVSAPCH